MEKYKKGINRRKFLATTGGATIMIGGFYLLPGCKQKNGPTSGDSKLLEKEISVWVRMTSDDQVIIYTPAAEMGQGSMTAVPVILAEEMDADWS